MGGLREIDYLLMLVKNCPFLGSLRGEEGALAMSEVRKLSFALACKRAKFRTRFHTIRDEGKSDGGGGKMDDEEEEEKPPPNQKLWPLVLRSATRAFDRYDYDPSKC